MKEGWEVKKIKDICDKASSNIAQNKINDIDGDYPIYGATGYIKNIDFYHRDTPYIGVVKDGAGVGRINTYPAFSSLLGTLQYILPKKGYSLEYVAYALKSLNLASYASGATIPHIYFKDYGESEIPVAPLPEQEKIVAELDCLSGIIDKKKQQLKELDALAQSIFYDMFGDPVENEKGWEVKKLGEVCSLKAGKSIKASELSPSLSDGLYPCFGGNGIRGYITKVSHCGTFPIIGRQGALCGNVVMSTEEFYATEHAVVVQPLVDMNVSWLYSALKFMNLNKLAQGVAQPGLSVGRVSEEYIPLPPLSLQHSFASKIEAIEKQKTLIKQSIAETETLFNSRMQYYFG